MKKNILILIVGCLLIFAADVFAEEGDFFFAPEVGWSHLMTDNLKDGIYTGAHFGYDTSDNLSIELILFYGDNNGDGANPDLRYVLGGGGLSYKVIFGSFKPMLFAGATVAGMDYSSASARFKGGFYTGASLEFYLNKVISLGISYKYIPLIKAPDASLLGFRFGFEL